MGGSVCGVVARCLNMVCGVHFCWNVTGGMVEGYSQAEQGMIGLSCKGTWRAKGSWLGLGWAGGPFTGKGALGGGIRLWQALVLERLRLLVVQMLER